MLLKSLVANLSRLVLILVLVLGGLGDASGESFGVSGVEKTEVKSSEGVRQVKAWEFALTKGLPAAWRKDPVILKYFDDLAENARLGQAVSVPNIPVTNYRGRFYARFKGANRDMQIHHAVPQAVYDTKYPGMITEAQLHSLENLRGIPNSARYNGTGLHNHIPQQWNAFYQASPNANLQDILDFTKAIDDDFGHLFIPPVR